jgi:hypothetical protein
MKDVAFLDFDGEHDDDDDDGGGVSAVVVIARLKDGAEAMNDESNVLDGPTWTTSFSSDIRSFVSS